MSSLAYEVFLENKNQKNRRILITGFAGSIGSELFRQLAPNNKVFGLDIDETRMFDLLEEYRLKGCKVDGRIGDIRDYETLEEVFYDFKPEIVFHAAALKHVAPNEMHRKLAVQTNIFGTDNVLRLAKIFKVKKLINISTDKVVNGESIMGLTKKIAEQAVKNEGYNSVRFGNVMGSRGSLLTIWARQFAEGEPLTITDERMERYFMSIPDAVNLVKEASQIAKPGEIVILDMGKPKKIIDFKQELYGDYPYRIIGIKPGETLSEKLMTEEESARAVRHGNFYII